MGEYADLFLDGTFCEWCGALILDDSTDFGVPRKCEDCKEAKRRQNRRRRKRQQAAKALKQNPEPPKPL